MQILLRGGMGGVAFGLAAAILGAWLNVIPTLERGFGGSPLFAVRVVALEIALGAVLGLALCPALLLRGGRVLHPIAVALAWYGLEQWVALDSPLFNTVATVIPAAALALTGGGLWLARRRPGLSVSLAGVLLVAGLAAAPVLLATTRPAVAKRAELPAPAPGSPDVVLVVLDTVRAQNLSAYGYERPTAPVIEGLAEEGALFADATSPSTWSLPSHASLFTGRYPSSHGAHAEHRYLDDRYPTLAQVLQAKGYETLCFTANGWISDGLGLTRGFSKRDDAMRGVGGAGLGFSFIHRLLDRLGWQDADKGGGVVVASFERWARERPRDARPAFVFLNFIEAHFPYHQLPGDHLFRFTDESYGTLRDISIDLLGAQFGGEGRPVEEVREPVLAMYDGGVVYSDELLGRVVEALRSRGSLEDTVLVVLADHGEVLGERGGFFGHGPSLYQESIGVPLLVRYPPRVKPGVRVETPVSTLGVFATILDLAKLTPPPTLQVQSLVPVIEGDPAAAPGPILSELFDARDLAPPRDRPDIQMQAGRRYRLLREGNLKLVTTSQGEAFLYDLTTDPTESRDLAPERPEAVNQMLAKLEAIQEANQIPDLDAELATGESAPELDEATKANLRALGYIE